MDRLVYRCGECELDVANRAFTRSGKPYALEAKVFALLSQLLKRPGELLIREQLLDAVWGHRYVTPSTLNRVIVLARRALGDDPEAPRFIQTVHGAGYRYIGPVESASSGAAEPEVRFLPPASVRMPARLQSLVGREHELGQIESILRAGARSLTVVGTGGMGKTQCALAFAHDYADRYPDGVWFFDLAPLRQASEWLQALAAALTIAPPAPAELLERIAQSLVDRRALFLLDNCDRLSGEIGALVVELLRGTRELVILATSQQQLNFVSERILHMPPLGLPPIRRPGDESELLQIAAAPAVALLLARIRDARAEFKLTLENAAAIVDVCQRLDGMPLALELAAARFALLSPEQVLERLDQRFRFLVSDTAGRDHRHRNLVALLEWAFGLLSQDEQRLLAWLGVFVQGCTVEAVISLAPQFGTSPEAIVDLLTGLANKSLVSTDQSVGPPRYRLLESVREFALERLRQSDDEPRARDAHLSYILRLAKVAHEDMLGGRMRERIAMLVLEHANIDSASEYAAGPANRRQDALQIAGSLTVYLKAHGGVALGARLCDRALDGAPAAPTRDLARALLCRGVGRWVGLKIATAEPLLEAMRIASEVGDGWTIAYASGHLSLWLTHDGQLTEAARHIATLERIAEESNDAILRGLAGLARGWISLAEGSTESALGALRPVRMLGGDRHQHHFIDMYIGLSLFRKGDDAAAAAQWYEAMRVASELSNNRGVAGATEGCAYLAARMGKAEESARLLSAAEHIRQRVISPLFSFWYQHNQHAHAAARAALGPEKYAAAISAGGRMRTEDAVTEVAVLLREFAAGVKAS